MRNLSRVLVVLAVAVVAGTPLSAQTTDISGAWNLQLTANLPEVMNPCVFSGTAAITQLGAEFSGTANLSYVSGPEGCPMEMMATLGGAIDGNLLQGTLDGGKAFGTATFTGTLDGTVAMVGTLEGAPSSATLAPKATPAGRMTTDSGPFAGTAGNWLAARQSVLEIPTLTETGLLLMAILLLATATYFLMRRQQHTP